MEYNLNERKLNPDEQLSAFEKVLLITGHINYTASTVKDVMISRYQTSKLIADGLFGDERKGESEFHKKLADDTSDLLKETAKKLNTIYEELVDFCNGCDAVSEIDIQIGEPIFNAMNDLVKTDTEQ
jgi:hypothetical protein